MVLNLASVGSDGVIRIWGPGTVSESEDPITKDYLLNATIQSVFE